MYTSTKLTVFDVQHDKLKNAIAHQKPITIKLDLDHSRGGGEHTLLLIETDWKTQGHGPSQQKTSESKRTASR